MTSQINYFRIEWNNIKREKVFSDLIYVVIKPHKIYAADWKIFSFIIDVVPTIDDIFYIEIKWGPIIGF